jgi:predicted dehydrogenase
MKNLAIIGAGNFSSFALPQMMKNEEINFIGILDSEIEKAKSFQLKFGGIIFNNLEEILSSPAIDLVYIATPPWHHYPTAKACLFADKHVISEKPAALKVEEVQQLIDIARERNKLYVVDLMQRYNPIYNIVKEIIDQNIFGVFLHGFFENYAADESSDPNHWFWEESKSGGIFIEHAVHFFDMFEGWFGEGSLLSSLEVKRKGTPIENKAADRVQAIVQYGTGIVNFYHAFDQPNRMDRQEIRLVFEKGSFSLFDWVPTRFKIEAIVTSEDLEKLQAISSLINISILEKYNGIDRIATGRFKPIETDFKVELTYSGDSKTTIYQQLLSSMINDQIKWLNDVTHKRIITEENAFNSLKMAVEAHEKAEIIKL